MRGVSLWAGLRLCALRWKALGELGAWAAASWARQRQGQDRSAQRRLSWLWSEARAMGVKTAATTSTTSLALC